MIHDRSVLPILGNEIKPKSILVAHELVDTPMNDTTGNYNRVKYLDSLERMVIKVPPILSLQIETSKQVSRTGVTALLERFTTLSQQVNRLVSNVTSENSSLTEVKDFKQTSEAISKNVEEVLVLL
jgi:hypothetical protein